MRIIKVFSCLRSCPKYVLSNGVHYCTERMHVLTEMAVIQSWCPLDTPQTSGFVEASAQQPTANTGERPTEESGKDGSYSTNITGGAFMSTEYFCKACNAIKKFKMMCMSCASELEVATTPSASNNSDYVAALRFGIAAILDSVPDTETITRIINEVQRLNAQKDAHCT